MLEIERHTLIVNSMESNNNRLLPKTAASRPTYWKRQQCTNH